MIRPLSRARRFALAAGALPIIFDRDDSDLSPLATLTGRYVLWVCLALVVVGVVGLLAVCSCGG